MDQRTKAAIEKENKTRLCVYCTERYHGLKNEPCSECYYEFDENGKRHKPNFKSNNKRCYMKHYDLANRRKDNFYYEYW